MVCAYEKQPVPAEEAVQSGLKWRTGNMSSSIPAEIDQTAPESSRMIEVHEFVKTGQNRPYLPRSPSITWNRIFRILREKDITRFLRL